MPPVQRRLSAWQIVRSVGNCRSREPSERGVTSVGAILERSKLFMGKSTYDRGKAARDRLGISQEEATHRAGTLTRQWQLVEAGNPVPLRTLVAAAVPGV